MEVHFFNLISNIILFQFLYDNAVQPCRHSPHVATGVLNVATGSYSKVGL